MAHLSDGNAIGIDIFHDRAGGTAVLRRQLAADAVVIAHRIAVAQCFGDSLAEPVLRVGGENLSVSLVMPKSAGSGVIVTVAASTVEEITGSIVRYQLVIIPS